MIRVLALNDDNHPTMFVTETGVSYNNACDFIKGCLALPHIEPYNVRGFCIVDPWESPLADLEDDVVDDLFYFLEGVRTFPEDLCLEDPFVTTFNLFWNCSKEGWYV